MRLPGFFGLFFKSISQFFEIKKQDENELRYIREIPKFPYFSIKSTQKKSGYVLMQAAKDYEFAILYPLLANILSKKHQANIGLWMMRSRVESIYHASKHYQWLNHIRFNRFSDAKWSRLYALLGGEILFENSRQYKDDAKVKQLAQQFYSQLKSREDVLKISIDGMLLGDLMYDFYLRIANKPTVSIQDPFLYYVIEQGIHNYYCAKELFETKKIHCVITTYTTYTHHGIIVRHALKRGIEVYAFGNATEFVLKLKSEFPHHCKDYTSYSEQFSLLDNKEQKLAEAKEKFEMRFSGKIDAALYYMRSTGFTELDPNAKKIFKAGERNRVVVFLHCFFDSPHIYRNMLFPDFYTWLEFTLSEALKNTEVDFYVKPHPNALPGNEEIVAEFKQRFTGIHFLDKTVSNNQLIAEGFTAAITVYGTLAHEYPYRGIPVLCAGDNPHASFDFCYQPKSILEYAKAIQNISQLKVKASDKEEILKFYYMHNLIKASPIDKNIFGYKEYVGNGNDSEALIKFLDQYKNDAASFEDKMNFIEKHF
ncbi:MAG: hypothetical protein IPP56_01275 [Bacteroidetes bacterium]|nr:hypothetical protein [Bacteroidota bacterium]